MPECENEHGSWFLDQRAYEENKLEVINFAVIKINLNE